MNWMKALLETYDACISDPALMEDPVPLLPICHTTNQAQIEITLNPDGELCDVKIVPKEHQTTVIPCTESSGGRTSGLCPHPLADKLQYLIADYPDHIPTASKSIKSGYELYIDQLEKWCSSEFSNEKVKSVYKYVKSGTIFNDLINHHIIDADAGRAISKSVKPDLPLFSISKISGEQTDAFVRWRVDKQGDVVKDTWKDPDVQNSWISYYLSTKNTRGLCYISGKEEVLADMHPSKIRNAGDKAKLISANDTSGFVFRGRFETSDQACGIGFETTQKAHNALRWLIGRQGYREGDLCIVSWTPSGKAVPSPLEGYYDFFEVDTPQIDTGFNAAMHLNKRIGGYNSKILDENVMIMAMNSATPGRLSILMYRETLGKDFMERLEKWHLSCAWKHHYAFKESEGGKHVKITFVGAPSPKDIAKAAYGEKADVKIISHAIQRILPCILDGKKIPKDLVDSAVRRASNPVSMEPWEWEKTLSIACSIYKQWSGVEYTMVLDPERKTRDYLYGRLLAVADVLESEALKSANEERQTTAMRFMQRFSEFPYSTWKDIELALNPYLSRLGPKAIYYEKKLDEIMSFFDPEEFTDNSKQKGEFLLAFHSEKAEHYRKKEKNDKNMEE